MKPLAEAEHAMPNHDSLEDQKLSARPSCELGGDIRAKVFRIVLPLVILAAGYLGFRFLSHQPEKAPLPPSKPQAIRTQVIELRGRNYPIVIKTHGTVRPREEIALSAQISGKVSRISPLLHDGAFFSAGEVLLEIEAADYETALAIAEARLVSARAALQLARVNHERNAELLKNSLLSRIEADVTAATFSQAAAEVDSASAQLDRAKRDLERTKIYAPFDGCVRKRSVGLGQLVGPSTPLATIFSVESVEVRLPIATRELPFLRLPQSAGDAPVSLELRDAINRESTTVWAGEIIRSEGTLDENSLELFVIARVRDPFGRTTGKPPLRIGQPVLGTIQGVVLTNVMALPRRAVREMDRIFMVDKKELMLSSRNIIAVWSDEEHIVVRDTAIPDGTLLATTHLVYAPEGSKVEIIPDVPPAMSTSLTNTLAPSNSIVSSATKKES